jgi:DNA-binding NarL/FixJ family response regulator
MAPPLPYTVVVVEDLHDFRSLWSLMLDRDPRFAVVGQASDGRAGAAAAEQHQPDLVLLDIAMPVLDGLQALPLIREQSPRSKVVMLSSWNPDSPQAAQAMRLGADGYVRKGLSRAVLLAKLEEILGAGTRPGPASWC